MKKYLFFYLLLGVPLLIFSCHKKQDKLLKLGHMLICKLYSSVSEKPIGDIENRDLYLEINSDIPRDTNFYIFIKQMNSTYYIVAKEIPYEFIANIYNSNSSNFDKMEYITYKKKLSINEIDSIKRLIKKLYNKPLIKSNLTEYCFSIYFNNKKRIECLGLPEVTGIYKELIFYLFDLTKHDFFFMRSRELINHYSGKPYQLPYDSAHSLFE